MLYSRDGILHIRFFRRNFGGVVNDVADETMNLRIQGDRTFNCYATFEFYGVRKLWSCLWEVEDILNTVCADGEVIAYIDITVVGRKFEDIKQLILEFDDHKVVMNPGPDKFANLSPIVLYSEGRDFWTNQLRKMALGYEKNEQNKS